MALKLVDKSAATQSIDALVQQYVEYREQKKVIDERMKSIAQTLKDYAVKNGVEDANGSTYVETDKGYRFGNQAKMKIFFNDSAIPFLKGKGFTDCIEVKEVVDEKAVENRVSTGELSAEDLTEITTSKVTYAIDVKKLEVPQDVQEVAPVAASRKPRTLKRK